MLPNELKKLNQKRYIGAMKYYNNIPKTIKTIKEYRVKVLEHKNTYGIESAINAFDVSRSTIYNWQRIYKKSLNNANSLIPKATRPKCLRKSKIDYRIIDEIAKPIYNGKIERYNRTIQEGFIDPDVSVLFGNIDCFNSKLADWLIFYTTKRPHFSHRDNNDLQIPPLKAYINMLNLDIGKSNMLWTHTSP